VRGEGRALVLRPIVHGPDAVLAGAGSAAIHPLLCLDPMADDFAAAMGTGRGQRLDGTLKAIEGMRRTRYHHLKGFVIVIPTGFALCHGHPSSR